MLAFEPSVSQHRDTEIKVSHTRSLIVICSYILMTAVPVGSRGQWCNERQRQTQAAALEGIFCSHPCPPPPSTEAKSQSQVKQLCLWDAGVCLRLEPCLHEKGQVHTGPRPSAWAVPISVSHEGSLKQMTARGIEEHPSEWKGKAKCHVWSLVAERGLLREGHSLWGSCSVWVTGYNGHPNGTVRHSHDEG